MTTAGRSAIQRQAAASIAMIPPAGSRSTSATRSRYGVLNEISHCDTAKVDTTMAATIPAAAARRRPWVDRSRSCVPMTPSATPNGKNAASEWKYEPRVEWRVKSSDCARKTRRNSEDHARTSGRSRSRHEATSASGPSRTKKTTSAVTAFVTTAPAFAAATSGKAPRNRAAVGGASRKKSG